MHSIKKKMIFINLHIWRLLTTCSMAIHDCRGQVQTDKRRKIDSIGGPAGQSRTLALSRLSYKHTSVTTHWFAFFRLSSVCCLQTMQTDIIFNTKSVIYLYFVTSPFLLNEQSTGCYTHLPINFILKITYE